MGWCGKRREEPIGTEGANGGDTGLPERKTFRHYIVKQRVRRRRWSQEKSQTEALVKDLKRLGHIYLLRLSKS